MLGISRQGAAGRDISRQGEEVADNDGENLRSARFPGEKRSDTSGDSLGVRPERQTHLRGASKSSPSSPGGISPVDVEPGGEHESERQQIIQQTVNAVLQEIHLHVPVRETDLETLSKLRDQLPEIYEQHVENMRASRELEEFQTHARYEIPAKYAHRGQTMGLAATVATLAVVAFAVWAQAYWIAGVLGVVDLVAIAAVFGSNQKPQER